MKSAETTASPASGAAGSESAAAVVRMLAEKKGLDPGQISGMDYAAFKETQYDQLSQTLRRHMDMEQVYRILEEGI